MKRSDIAATVWLPLPAAFRRALLDSAAAAFAGQTALQTSSGETVRIDNVIEYGFRKGTVYRTATSHALFKYLVRVLNGRYPPKESHNERLSDRNRGQH